MNPSNDIHRAAEFVSDAHKHLVRTTVAGVSLLHVKHLQEVADLVWASGGTDTEIVAAWLHDTIEDTEVTLEEVEKLFGKEVAEIVDGLTDPLHFKGMPLQERKPLQAERLSKKSESVRRIKIADQTSNLRFLTINPSTTMKDSECAHYIRGAKLLADQCRGISPLLDEMFDKVYKEGLKRFPLN